MSGESRPVGTGGLGWAIEMLSCIMENPAVLGPDDLVKLSREVAGAWLSTCFLEAVASVENPFAAGFTLSVALAKAAVVAPRGERRKLNSLQNKLDCLLLEILERLPQTVQGFHGGMAGCASVFEPEVEAGDARGRRGPMWMVLQSRGHMETFCAQPLIVDFLTRRFTHGLPSVVGMQGVPTESEEILDLVNGAAHGLSLAIDVQDKLTLGSLEISLDPGYILETILSPCLMLQGWSLGSAGGAQTSLSVFPELQFLTAGLVYMPDAYYRVPAMRMALDVIVYLGTLAVFSAVILLHDDGPLTTGEIVFALHILVGLRLAGTIDDRGSCGTNW